ncbi:MULTISPECIES: hypothetical protein [Shewanella]|jgi:hypothetical protein|uniref:Uncharacterized protein n=1 Tax=Shewanella holmiensis TaxID=2952222 RepID=A0A9X2WMC0_9GAMM|nr:MULTISPECIES: hypothetical protein [Shewanella]MCT7941804.1 hypothetical protein [Shewanella holmiensis]MDP5146558.1 hypothetical protein [Shewanella sp. ULN5]
MTTDSDELLKKHSNLIHSEGVTVESHTQREQGEWFLQTLMVKGYDVPFKYRRNKKYKNLTGQKVNLTYYPREETIAGFKVETMQVVRVRRF